METLFDFKMRQQMKYQMNHFSGKTNKNSYPDFN